MRRFRYLAASVALILLFVGVGIYVNRQQQPPERPLSATAAQLRPKPVSPPPPTMSLNPGQPRRLHISKLGIDAPVEAVGITNAGEMADPKNASDATWYQYGYVPGAYGNAAIAGHYLYQSRPALFYRLHELREGDGFTIINEHAMVLIFRVVDSQRYTTESAPLAEIFGASKIAQVRLITCYGTWDKTHERYRERLVVTAAFVREVPAQ